MYESQFLLKRRPFAATPDPRCFLASGPIQAALDELVVCVEQGQGIAIVSAPAGTGKTLLCERLRIELNSQFEIVFLHHASFLTRRALLQSILADLNHAYRRHDEQELRLELIPAIRAINPQREALVLICDEAHMLSEDLLEELRILSDLADHGRPLVRLVLVGQPGLEETLARPGLEAMNQRIRAHVCLESFDRAASLDYIDYRITWAGGRTEEIFTPEALEVICRASQGMPRCINQLCDHSLLLAYVSEQKPVDAETILDALQDLRQLPLHWNESFLTDHATVSRPDEEIESIGVSTPGALVFTESSSSIALESPHQVQFVEFGADVPLAEATIEQNSDQTAADSMDSTTEFENEDIVADEEISETESVDESLVAKPQTFAVTRPDWKSGLRHQETLVAKPQTFAGQSLMVTAASPVMSPTSSCPQLEIVEEIVWDRYAAIDGGFPIPEVFVSIIQSLPDPARTVAIESGCDTPTEPQVRGNAEASEDSAWNDVRDLASHEISSNASLSVPSDVSVPSQSESHLEPHPEAFFAQDWSVPETLSANCSGTDEFDDVCARLEDLLPDVDENPGWDSASLEFGSDQAIETVASDSVGASLPSFFVANDEAASETVEPNSLEDELAASLCELVGEVREKLMTPNDGSSAFEELQELLGTAPGSSSIEIGSTSSGGNLPAIPARDAARPYKNLFSQLRRKQQGLL